jgi:hypothetical protein
MFTSKTPQEYEVWLAIVPFSTPGNMTKIRPIIITKVNSEEIEYIKLTSKRKKNYPLVMCPKLKRHTYRTQEKGILPIYNLVRYIGRS